MLIRLALCALALCTSLAARAERPNIVFIVSDDHSVPYLGSYGFPVKTPSLDRLAQQGMLLDRMFTTSPQCAPSRTAFATGQSAVATRSSRFTAGLPREVDTFPQILRREAGYYTGIMRRSHHLDGWHPVDATVTPAIRAKHQLDSAPERFDFVKMGGTEKDTAAYVAEFLGKVPAGKPFFMWVNFSDPHQPWNDAPRVNDPAKLPMPPDWPDLPELRDDFARFLDEVARLDSEYQAVVDQLDKRGLLKNTLIVFTGDNGTALPRGKASLYDRGLNVPLVVAWPGQIPGGRRSSALISGEDFAPTFLAAAGLPVPKTMSGQSFLPLLRGEAGYKPRELLFASRTPHGAEPFTEQSSTYGYDMGRMVRSDRYKLIVNYTPWIRYAPADSFKEPGWEAIQRKQLAGKLEPLFNRLYFQSPRPIVELFDLQADPYELNNLAGRPELAAVERKLKIALQEKMILDFDPLPLPLHE